MYPQSLEHFQYDIQKYYLQAVYFAVMRNVSTTNRNGFESLLKFYREADGVQEKEKILRKAHRNLN